MNQTHFEAMFKPYGVSLFFLGFIFGGIGVSYIHAQTLNQPKIYSEPTSVKVIMPPLINSSAPPIDLNSRVDSLNLLLSDYAKKLDSCRLSK